MATVAERQAERERRRREREASWRKNRKEQVNQPPPDQVTVVGGDPNFQLGGGTFSILGIAENQALGGAQIISDQVQFGNRFIQQQAGGAVNQPAVPNNPPAAPNNPPAAQNNPPAAQNNPPAAQNNPPAAPNNPAPQPGQENPAAEGEEPRDIQAATRDALEKEPEDDAEVEVDAASKGGKSRHRNFVNFLATDEVPESIFGIPVVQDESQYTEKDIEFFRKNPKAAGFYDLGDEEMEEEGDVPPVMALFGGDAGAYREAFAQKRKDLVNSTAERQYKALLKFKDPDHRRRAEAYLYAALDSDARNAALLDEYNRLAEANRPGDRRAQARYDELTERDRARFAGGAWEKALGELVSPDWVPPVEAPVAQARQEQSFVSRAKEALDVAKELPELFAAGAKRQAADVKETISAAGAVLTAPKVPGAEVYDPLSGTIRDGKTGRVKRAATDRDRADIHEVNRATGYEGLYRQDAKGGEAIEAPTLSDDRPMHVFRDDSGKVTGYGTTRSMVHEQDGRYYVIPTILADGRGGTRVAADGEAVGHFRKTREHWGGYADRWSAEDAAEAVHERHQRLYGKKWNDYIQDHWDEMSDEIKNDPGVADARHARIRGPYPGSLNNPGNVEKRKDRRQGEVDSPHGRWAKFATPQDGLREMADVIRQIAAVKLAEKGRDFTIRNFAEVYAPRVNKKGAKENDTDKYIRDLSADTGFDADEELARWDEGDMAKLLRSVVKFESGAKHSAWFTDDEYRTAAAKLQEGAFE